MAVKDLIVGGLGPSSVDYLVTDGLGHSVKVTPTTLDLALTPQLSIVQVLSVGARVPTPVTLALATFAPVITATTNVRTISTLALILATFSPGVSSGSTFGQLEDSYGYAQSARRRLCTAYVHSSVRPHRRLATLRTATDIDRSYMLMEEGSASLTIHQNDYIPNEGDILVIESPTMVPWVGFLNPSERRLDGNINFTAHGAASLLAVKLSGTTKEIETFDSSDSIFRQVLVDVARQGYSFFYINAENGPAVKGVNLGGSTASDTLREMHEFTDWEWNIDYETSSAFIKPTISWLYRVGLDASQRVSLRQGIHFTELRYKRDMSQLKKDVVAVGGSGNLSDRNTAIASTSDDRLLTLPAQLRTQRILYTPMTNNFTSLSNRTQQIVERTAHGAELYACTINDRLDWSKLQLGNYVNIWAYGQSRTVRIVGLQPDEITGVMELTLET